MRLLQNPHHLHAAQFNVMRLRSLLSIGNQNTGEQSCFKNDTSSIRSKDNTSKQRSGNTKAHRAHFSMFHFEMLAGYNPKEILRASKLVSFQRWQNSHYKPTNSFGNFTTSTKRKGLRPVRIHLWYSLGSPSFSPCPLVFRKIFYFCVTR